MLVKDYVLTVWLKFGDDIGIPGVANQYPALKTIGTTRRLSCSVQKMSFSIRRAGRSKIRQIGAERHLCINDRKTRRSSCLQDSRDRVDDFADFSNRDARLIKHATFCSKVILHVDHNHGGVG